MATPAATAAQPLIFAPAPAKVDPATSSEAKKRRLKLPNIAWRKLLRRKVLVPAGVALAVGLVGWGAFALVQYTRTQASPDTIFKDALANALVTKQVQVDRQTGTDHSSTLLDLTALKSPRVSSQASVTLAGASFGLKTYGSISDTYMSYTSLPSGLSNATTGVENHWVQLRRGGQLPAAINTTLSNAADPRYLAFGPLLFANLPPKTSQTLANYLVSHKVYGYDLAKVTSVPLGNKKALLYSGTFNAAAIQITNQSLATSEGVTVADVQRAVDALDIYKGGSSSLYIDAGTRLPVRLVLHTSAGQSVSYDYSNFSKISLPSQPSSNIDWPQFASTQLQLEAQASALQTAAQRDATRQANLAVIQSGLTDYYAKHGAYPSLANLNNQTWIAANMRSFDPDSTRDPQANTIALLATLPAKATTTINPKTKVKITIAATPIYGYVYQPTAAAGKACANEAATPTEQLCSLYSLTATLGTGQLYTVKNP